MTYKKEEKCNVVIWGAGKLYYMIKKDLANTNIVAIIDTNAELHGKILDGISIISPDQIKEVRFDYIIIAIHDLQKAGEVGKQLINMGVPQNKIVTRTKLPDITGVFPKVRQNKEEKELTAWLDEHETPKILVVSHDFSYSGIPIASQNMCMALSELGSAVVLASSRISFGPNIKNELENKNITYMEELPLAYGSVWFREIIKKFDLIVVSSITQKDFLQMCIQNAVKCMLWVHETDDQYYEDVYLLPEKNLYVYGGGNRVIKRFSQFYKDIPIKCLQYYLPETKPVRKKEKRNKVVFCFAASIIKRKAPDLVVKAIEGMPDRYRNKFVCLLIGEVGAGQFWNSYAQKVNDIDEIEMKGVMEQSKLDELIADIDVFLCPSRDDPMPIVVTQAMMHEKFCIISENVGQAEYIVQGENGFVFQNENIEELREYMMWAIDHPEQLLYASQKSRKIYDREFSLQAMVCNMKKAMLEMKV